jgi:hypothetical protein
LFSLEKVKDEIDMQRILLQEETKNENSSEKLKSTPFSNKGKLMIVVQQKTL